MIITDRDPVFVSGSPHDRGLAIAASGEHHRDAIQARLALLPELSADEAAWVEDQWQVQQQYLPDICGLVAGLAEGFGLTTRQLFTMHVRYAIEDRRLAFVDVDPDGCSTFAIRSQQGIIVAKNRDNPPAFQPLQSLVRQRDPAWGGREIVCVGTYGSAPSASSGMNSDGLCMTDTSVRTKDVGIGVLRYYLMEALLCRCADVSEALALIRSIPHLGGGNIVVGDAKGNMAFIEIGHRKINVGDDGGSGWLARTNHFLDPDLAADLTNDDASSQHLNSLSRLEFLVSKIPALSLDADDKQYAAVVAGHGEDGRASLCRHTDEVLTLSGVIYHAGTRCLLQSRGNPCGGEWERTTL